MTENNVIRRIILAVGAATLFFMIYKSRGNAPSVSGISYKLLFGILGFFLAVFLGILLFSIYVSIKNKWYDEKIKKITDDYYNHTDIYRYAEDIQLFVEEIRDSKRSEKSKNAYISNAFVTAGMFIYSLSGNLEKSLEFFSKVKFSALNTMLQYNYCYFRGMIFLDMGDIIKADKELANMSIVFKNPDYLKDILSANIMYHKGLNDEAEAILNCIMESKDNEIRTEMVYLQAAIDKEKKRFDDAVTKLKFLLEHDSLTYVAAKSKKLLEEIENAL